MVTKGFKLTKENGEYIGIVTVEDILEHIVGNVFDEYDMQEEVKKDN